MKFFEGRGEQIFEGVTFSFGEDELYAKNASGLEDVFQTSLKQVRLLERRKKRSDPQKFEGHLFRAYDCSEPVLHSVIRQKKAEAILCDHQNRSVIAEEKAVASILQAVS